MRLSLWIFLTVLLPTISTAAEAPSAFTPAMLTTAQQLMQRAAMDNIGYEVVQSLTTEVGARPAGSEAEARARQWAIKKLKTLGFENVREEPFEVPLWQRGIERAEITAPFPQSLTITALGGSASTGEEGVEGQVVAFPSLKALQKSNADTVGGKIVFVDEVMARSRDGSGYFEAVQKRRRAAFAARNYGAKAVLIRSVGTSSHRFAHTGQMRRIDYGSSKGVPAAALSAPDADQLRRALGYDKPVTIKLVLTPEILPPAPSGNVVAELVGRESPEEIVLVGAHLDSWDLGTGAIDDGVGVGIVVAATKLLMDQLPEHPKRTIRVVLFGSEEVGVVGAEAYAKQHASELEQHIMATESDFGSGDIWRFETRFAQDKLPLAKAIAGVLEGLGIESGENNASGGPDIKYLREAGVPVVTLRQDGSDYFDLHHTANDTLDKIAPNALDQNVAAYAAFLYLVAETEAVFH